MNSEQRSVLDFHKVIEAWSAATPSVPPTSVRRLRVKLIEEEFEEYREASEACDVVEVADALADLLYVVYGAALAWGIDMERVFAEVHRSNMTKQGGPIRADGKRLKPPDWQPPDLATVISEQR